MSSPDSPTARSGNDIVDLKDYEFDYAILDEAQAIKNAGSESAKAARLLRADHRLALSGTPVQNHLGDLWSLFDFLNPGMLSKAAEIGQGGFGLRARPGEEGRSLLAKALRPYLLRRTKPNRSRRTCPRSPNRRSTATWNLPSASCTTSYASTTGSRCWGASRATESASRRSRSWRQQRCSPAAGLSPRFDRQGQAVGRIRALASSTCSCRCCARCSTKGTRPSCSRSSRACWRSSGSGWTRKESPTPTLDGRTRDRQARVQQFQ